MYSIQLYLSHLTQAENQMERGLLLDVVVSQRAPVIQLLAGENQTLLVRRNTLLILNLGLHALNRIRRLHIKRNRLSSECLYEDLHSIV